MAWKKQNKYKNGKKIQLDDEEIVEEKDDPKYAENFLEDWVKCRDRHPGQSEVLKAVF